MSKKFTMFNIEDPMGFGKYDYLSLMEVAFYEHDYLEWMRNQEYIWFSRTVESFLAEIVDSGFDYHSEYYGYDFMLDDEYEDFSLRKLIEEYTGQEDEVFPKQIQLQQQRAENQRRHDESMKGVPTDDDIRNFIWRYYASGKMNEDTSFGKLRWKKIKSESGDTLKTAVYKTKFSLGELFLMKESYFKEEDGKWYGRYTFITEDSLKVVIKKTEKTSPKELVEMIEGCL